jgi:disulfide bond formation protein DsbB
MKGKDVGARIFGIRNIGLLLLGVILLVIGLWASFYHAWETVTDFRQVTACRNVKSTEVTPIKS